MPGDIDGKNLKTPADPPFIVLEVPIKLVEGEQWVVVLKGDGLGLRPPVGVSPFDVRGSPFRSDVAKDLVEAIRLDSGSRSPAQLALMDSAFGPGPGSDPVGLGRVSTPRPRAARVSRRQGPVDDHSGGEPYADSSFPPGELAGRDRGVGRPGCSQVPAATSRSRKAVGLTASTWPAG